MVSIVMLQSFILAANEPVAPPTSIPILITELAALAKSSSCVTGRSSSDLKAKKDELFSLAGSNPRFGLF